MAFRLWSRLLAVFALAACCSGLARAQTQAPPDGVTPYILLDLGPTGDELVGVQITGEAIRNALGLIPERSKPRLVILRFNCNGGMLREVPNLVELITLLQKDARVVAWVDNAASAAALTAMACPEIIMTPGGAIGAAVTYEMKGGSPVSLQGEELDRALAVGAEIARRTGRDPRLIHAMQTPTTLSYDVGTRGGITLHDDATGQTLLNAEGSILTLSAPQAQELGVSLGTADTLDQVMALLGVQQARDVGLIAKSALDHQMSKASAALARMTQGVTDLWDTLDRARSAETSTERAYEISQAGDRLAELKQDAKDWPSVAEYLGLDEPKLGSYSQEITELRTGPKGEHEEGG